MERRLAAILIADVVGYSRLSQIDEEGTRARFQADQNDVFEPAIARHHDIVEIEHCILEWHDVFQLYAIMVQCDRP